MLTIIDVWAPWCGPCKMMMPVIEKLAKEYNVEDSDINVVQINADEDTETVEKYQIKGIPTLIFERDGEILAREVGVRSEADIRKIIEIFTT
jgi:thioredoxin